MQRCVWLHKEPLDTFACKVAKRQALWPAVSVPYLSIEGTGTNMLAGFPTCEICVTYGETLWNAVKWKRRTPAVCVRMLTPAAWWSWTWLDQATARIGFGAPADHLVSSNHQRFLPSEIRPDPTRSDQWIWDSQLSLTSPNGQKHCVIIGSRDELKFLASSKGSHIFTPPACIPISGNKSGLKKPQRSVAMMFGLGMKDQNGHEWTRLIHRESFGA